MATSPLDLKAGSLLQPLSQRSNELATDTGGMLPPPGPEDHVIFLRGLPIAPWMRLRPSAYVWRAWLAHLQARAVQWQAVSPMQDTPLAIPATPDEPEAHDAALTLPPTLPDEAWQAWREAHVHMIDVRRVIGGIEKLSRLLQSLGEQFPETVEAHVIGHSVGGAVVLTYLAALRAQVQSPPPVRLRVALSLDAAVAGIAGLWSGAKSYLLDLADDGLHGLHAWAEDQGIAVLAASNEGDVWSHRCLGDLPYLGARFGSRLALRDQIDGTTHDWLRRTPEFVQAVWGPLTSPEGSESH